MALSAPDKSKSVYYSSNNSYILFTEINLYKTWPQFKHHFMYIHSHIFFIILYVSNFIGY